jgi:Secretion system C-terminal sorting domain
VSLKTKFQKFKSNIMKKIFTLVGFLIACLSAQAQFLDITPGLGTLDDAIKADTNANGTRKDVNRIYRLKRGGVYVLRGMISHTDYNLRIEAEAGTAARPLILYQGGGVAINQLFEAKGNISFKGVHLTVRDLTNAIVERVIALSADNIRCQIDDCLADDTGQTVVRVNNKDTKIYLTNSVFSRSGRPQDPDNGRIIDKRGPSLDSLIIDNCAIYNVTSRVMRDGGAANPSNYIKINQNTIWGVGQRGFSFGKTINLIVTNNIFQNMAIFGTNKNATVATKTYVLEPDTTARGKNWTISNNNFSSNPEVIAALPFRARNGLGDTLEAAKPYNLLAEAVATKTTTEMVTFKKAPALPTYLVEDFRKDTTSASTRPNARNWDHSGLNKNTVLSQLTTGLDRYSETHDFAYGTWRAIHRGGTEGQPIGVKFFGYTTKTSDLFDAQGVLMYPNPSASDKLYVVGLDKVQVNRVQVVNIAGQVVFTQNTEGVEFLTIDVSKLSLGTYLLNMVNKEGKISSRKFVKE